MWFGGSAYGATRPAGPVPEREVEAASRLHQQRGRHTAAVVGKAGADHGDPAPRLPAIQGLLDNDVAVPALRAQAAPEVPRQVHRAGRPDGDEGPVAPVVPDR